MNSNFVNERPGLCWNWWHCEFHQGIILVSETDYVTAKSLEWIWEFIFPTDRLCTKRVSIVWKHELCRFLIHTIVYYTLLLINNLFCFLSYVRKRNWRRWRKGWDNGQNNVCRTKDLRCLTFQCVQTAVCIGICHNRMDELLMTSYSMLKLRIHPPRVSEQLKVFWSTEGFISFL